MILENINNIGYVPRLYDGELIYSLIARYGRYTCHYQAHSLNQKFFRTNRRRISIDLPTNLSNFISASRLCGQDSQFNIVENHTLYNFYAAFMSDVNRRRFKAAMLHPQERGSKVGVRRQSAIGTPGFLRFCPDCREEMIGEHGEAYWRREHQIPIVRVCTKHRRLLVDSNVAAGRDVYSYVPLTEKTQFSCAALPLKRASQDNYEFLARIADRATELLREPPPPATRSELAKIGKDKVVGAGFSRNRKGVHSTELSEAAYEYLNFLQTIWPNLKKYDPEDNIILYPTRVMNASAHPVYQVFFADFLAQQPKPELKSGTHIFRAHDADWPCFNPIHTHEKKPKVSVIAQKKMPNYTRALFSCECGYAYYRRRYSTGAFGKPRLKNFGPTLKPLLHDALREKLSLKKIGDLTGLRVDSLKIQAALLGVELTTSTKRSTNK